MAEDDDETKGGRVIYGGHALKLLHRTLACTQGYRYRGALHVAPTSDADHVRSVGVTVRRIEAARNGCVC